MRVQGAALRVEDFSALIARHSRSGFGVEGLLINCHSATLFPQKRSPLLNASDDNVRFLDTHFWQSFRAKFRLSFEFLCFGLTRFQGLGVSSVRGCQGLEASVLLGYDAAEPRRVLNIISDLHSIFFP